MNYNISETRPPRLQRMGRAQNASNYYALSPKISCFHPLFRCFFPLFGLICAKRNFSIQTKFGRKRVV